MPSSATGVMRPADAPAPKIARPELGLGSLETAIVQTVAYADVFDFPLTCQEIHRYLIGLPASLSMVQAALDDSRLVPRYLTRSDGHVALRGREATFATRCRRAHVAAGMWPRAVRYGSTIARLPFVRMVAVTGAACMANAEAGGDADYFIVTAPDRLWLCRAAIIALVRLAARAGDDVCPNYLLSERSLLLQQRDLYTAHEFLQMAPIAGRATYRRMWQMNAWTADFLPNAYQQAQWLPVKPLSSHPVRSLVEVPLRTPVGAWLDNWEMRRKIGKFDRLGYNQTEATFGADCCKGHFVDYGQRTLVAFADRLRQLETN